MEKSRKKVLIDATKCVAHDNDGIQRYGIELLRGLLSVVNHKNSEWEIDVYVGMWFTLNLLDAHEIILFHNLKSNKNFKLKIVLWTIRMDELIHQDTRQIFSKFVTRLIALVKKWMRKFFRQMRKFFQIFFKPPDFSNYDLVHLLLPQTYENIARSKIPALLTTVHDLTHLHCPQFHTQGNIANTQNGLDFLVARESAFVAVSKFTRGDLLATYQKIDPEDVYTVYEACDPKKFYQVQDLDILKTVREKYGIPERPYLLSLSTLEPRKNILNTIKAFLFLIEEIPDSDVVFVIAGKKGWKYDTLINDQWLKSERVIFTGFIADQDLAALYSGALALSYVSYYEGFGLPALEAMSCGTPVIYGNNSSLPEVIGDGGLAADPDDIEDIKEKFRRIVLDEEARHGAATKALHRAKHFSWEKTVDETLHVYQKVIERSHKNITR